MKEIYKSNKIEKKVFSFFNTGAQELIISINDKIYESVELADVKDNCRVVQLELNDGDIVKVNENENIKVTINE